MNMNLMEVCKSYELPVKYLWRYGHVCLVPLLRGQRSSLKDASDDEEDMLDQAFFVEDNSRLGCQIFMHPDLEGLAVTLAPESD